MKTKRIFALLFCFFLLVQVPNGIGASPNGVIRGRVFDYSSGQYGVETEFDIVGLNVNGTTISGEIPGIVLNGRTLAPLRVLAEAIGAEVLWSQEAAEVTIQKRDTNIVLTLGSAYARVNGQVEALPDGVPATAVFLQGQGHTMVPARFFAEQLGCDVRWNQESYWVSIQEKSYITGDLIEGLTQPVSSEKFVIALDAGHGGGHSGAYYELTAEKDLNWSMTQKLNQVLRALGYKTVLTRAGDEEVSLLSRARTANGSKADIFVSIHCNAAENAPDFEGLYVYHYPGSTAGKKLAQTIQTAACAWTGAVDRKINTANFSVLRNTKMPAVLVETGFMSCHAELLRLKSEDYQWAMARGIAEGVIRYLNGLG